jgi:hypothetical protein
MISIFNVSGNLLTMLQEAVNQPRKEKKISSFIKVASGAGKIF